MALSVVFADAHLLAIDKPPGRLVIPGRGLTSLTVQDEVQASFGRVWAVHRLDRGTSGVLLFARSAEAHRSCNLAFDRHQVEKRYLALVRGVPPSEARLDVPIAPGRRGRMRPARSGDARGKPAVTLVRVLEVFAGCHGWPPLALVEALPQSGRTHQIRVHLAWAGTPLAVDPDYGEAAPLIDDAGKILLDRTPLHAARLVIAHPVSGTALVLEAPLPIDMGRMLAYLRGAPTCGRG